MKKVLLLLCVCSIPFAACHSKKEKALGSSVKYSRHGRFLIKETFDSNGKLLVKQSFNKDTVPDGAMMEYYPNGIIATWRWFIYSEKNPRCGVFFKENGSFDTLKGVPFLVAQNPENSPGVEFINPPQIKFQAGYKETFKNQIIYQTIYNPTLTDSISFIPLNEYKYAKGHKYEVYFYIVDTVKKRSLYQDSLELIGQ